jgi:hypothetical protein
MFLDLDEFLILKDCSIGDFIRTHLEVDSISFHWLLYYGSPGQYEDLPLSERFQRPIRNHRLNNHLKSLARLSAVRSAGAHICNLTPEAKAVLSDGVTVNRDGAPGAELGAQINNNIKHGEGIFVAHFQSKSLQEYRVRRMRGCALSGNGSRNATHRPMPDLKNPDCFPPDDALVRSIYEESPVLRRETCAEIENLRRAVEFDRVYREPVYCFFEEQAEVHDQRFV